MDEIHTTGNGNAVVVVEVPILSCGIITSVLVGSDKGTIDGVDVDGGVARHIDESRKQKHCSRG